MQLNSCAQARGNKPWLAPQIVKVMKLTALLITIACLHVSAKVFSQISLSGKNVALSAVFTTIQKQSGYAFFYKDKIVENIKVNPDLHNATLEQALDQVLKDLPLTYNIVDKTVVIKQAEPSFFDNFKNKIKAEFAQVTVTGKVVDETGQPMPGVTVKQKDNPNNGMVTDSKGAYTLTVPDNNIVISFSFVGYETIELAAKNIAPGSVITLKAALQNLREIVINKGPYNEKRELSISSVGVVDSKTISEQPVSDPIQALIGRVAGLDIQQTSGLPGAYSTIHIRGLNSLTNGNDPYYIVDGVPFSSLSLTSPNMNSGSLGFPTSLQNNGTGLSPFNILNPDDIESIEVLKDADATSIYGTKGANGVIIITTKKGKAGDTKVTFDLSQGIGQVGHFMDLLNTPQYLQMMHRAYANDGQPFPNDPNDGNYDIDGAWDTTRYTNWQKVLIGNTAHYTNAQGSISGGDANTQFLISGAYNRATTVFPGDYGDTKGSVHFSLTHASSNQKFHVQFAAGYGYETNDMPQLDFTSQIILPPDAPELYNPDGSINWKILNGSYTFSNPLSISLQNSNQITNHLVSNLNLSYQLLPGLMLQSSFGYNYGENNQTELSPSTAQPPPYNTDPTNRRNYFANTTSQGWSIEPQLNYQKKIGKGQLNILLGGTIQQNAMQSYAQYAMGFSSDALITDPAAATAHGVTGYSNSLVRYEAFLARISYIWDDEYILNITGNRDGSSNFGPGKQYGNFGSLGAGWIFTKEKAVTDAVSWLSFGKLRASYGTTGNGQLTPYKYLSTYNPNSSAYQGTTVLIPSGLTNPYFAWEVDRKLQGGLDLGFLKDRISLSVDYYRNRTSNQLIAYPLPAITGFGSIIENLPANIQNTGLEAELHTINFQTNDFNWSTSIIFTLPNNKLVSFPGFAASTLSNTYTLGQSLFTKKVYQYTGVNPQTGLYTFATQNTNGIPSNPQDLVTSAPITQKYYGGLTNSFNYKGFSLDIFIQFVKQLGYSYKNYFPQPGSELYAPYTNNPTAVLNAWQTPGQTAGIERYGTSGSTYTPYSLLLQSTGVITDASFIRLKNVALSYKLPVKWQQWAHMQNAKIYVNGQNLYTFTKYIGLDPETQGLGLPPLRVIMLGISASF